MDEATSNFDADTDKSTNGNVGTRVSEKTSDLKRDLRELGKIASDATREQFGKLQEQGMEQARRVAEEIKGHPLSSLLIAAGVGLLMGYLLRSGGESSS